MYISFSSCMEPSSALECRRLDQIIPYRAEAWDKELRNTSHLAHFAKVPRGTRYSSDSQIHSLSTQTFHHPHGKYIIRKSNPADGPSRVKYGQEHLFLPPSQFPHEIRHIVIDVSSPVTPTELCLFCNGQYSIPVAKVINCTLILVPHYHPLPHWPQLTPSQSL